MTTNSETKQIRRVVTGHANGKSVIKSDEVLSTYHFKAIPGFGHTMIWASDGVPNLSDEPKADYPTSVSFQYPARPIFRWFFSQLDTLLDRLRRVQ